MLDDDMNDQLGLFGAVTGKKEVSAREVRRKEGAGDVPVEVDSGVQADAVATAAEPDVPATPPREDNAIPAVKVKPTASSKRTTSARSRGKVSDVKLPVKAKPVSGLVPAGDVRLTANIREDLHLKLKIAAVHRRTTIGELIEELVDRYL